VLRARGAPSFLDRDALVTGVPCSQRLEDALRSLRAVAVFIGPNGFGAWQKREMYFALDRQAQEEKQGHPFSRNSCIIAESGYHCWIPVPEYLGGLA
jgi:hypothetical protein